ncbi:MAG: photosystem I assembly protein Ycf3 [Chloroflexi bacterium ADurb.Bin222]|nr:MAG: photosystem I assembly protein Ycf3 [Chloroflexi bacterium ADurb.Bin222]
MWDLEREPAEDALDALARRSLILFEPVPDRARDAGEAARYALHDLARLWAGEQATDEERAAAAYRHAEHYEQVLRAARDTYLQGDKGILAGLTLYDREAHNIHAGFAWASSPPAASPPPGETEEGRTALCSAYPDAGAYILTLRLHPRERIRWLEAALRAARALGCRSAEGVHLGNLGLAYADLGDARRAIEFHEQALVIVREIGDRRGEGADLSNLGLAYADLGDARRAIEFYEQALVIDREIGDRRGEGSILGNLGIAYKDLGDARRAIEFYEQCLTLHREIGDRRGEGNALGNLGIAYKNLGDARCAIEFYEQALEIEKEIGDRRAEGSILGNLGSAYADLGDARRAIEFYEQRLVIAREIGDRRGEGNALGGLGNAYLTLGDARRAIEFYEQRLVIAREIGDRRGEAKSCWNLGVAYTKQGRYAEACALMRVTVEFERTSGHAEAEEDAQTMEQVCAQAEQKSIPGYEAELEDARQRNDEATMMRVLARLGAAYLSENARKALDCYNNLGSLAKRTDNALIQIEALRGAAQAYQQLKDYLFAIERYEWAVAIAQRIADPASEGELWFEIAKIRHALGESEDAWENGHTALTVLENAQLPSATMVRDWLATLPPPTPEEPLWDIPSTPAPIKTLLTTSAPAGKPTSWWRRLRGK